MSLGTNIQHCKLVIIVPGYYPFLEVIWEGRRHWKQPLSISKMSNHSICSITPISFVWLWEYGPVTYILKSGFSQNYAKHCNTNYQHVSSPDMSPVSLLGSLFNELGFLGGSSKFKSTSTHSASPEWWAEAVTQVWEDENLSKGLRIWFFWELLKILFYCCIQGEPDRKLQRQPTFCPQLQYSRVTSMSLPSRIKEMSSSWTACRPFIQVRTTLNLLHNCLEAD